MKKNSILFQDYEQIHHLIVIQKFITGTNWEMTRAGKTQQLHFAPQGVAHGLLAD
jgi:hypothetical protein